MGGPRASFSPSPYHPGLISRSLLPTAPLALVPQRPVLLPLLPADGWIHRIQLPENGELIAMKWLILFCFHASSPISGVGLLPCRTDNDELALNLRE